MARRALMTGGMRGIGKLADGFAAEHDRDGILAFEFDPGPVWTERVETQHERTGYPKEISCPIDVPAAMAALWPECETAPSMNPNWSPTAILDWREPGRGRRR